jgi:hypothetical protein
MQVVQIEKVAAREIARKMRVLLRLHHCEPRELISKFCSSKTIIRRNFWDYKSRVNGGT